MEEKRVVVTGLGVISPLGNDINTFWKALKDGKSGVGPLTFFDPSGFDSRIAGEVKVFDPALYGISAKDTKRMDRFVQFAVASTRQAITDSGLN
jgi:3-oxoacyl-[acyl-carrier-protein] synthase II